MKRLCQILAAVVVTLALPVAVGQPAYAARTCDIGFTGPDSNNMCTSTETYECSVTSTNEVTITNSSQQTVASGRVSVSGNNSGGSTTSGSVTNSDGTSFSVTIVNSGTDDEGDVSTCTATVVVPATETPETVQPTPTTTRPAGGAGAVRPAVGAASPEVLPTTSGDNTLRVLSIVAGATAAVASVAVVSGLIYRRAHNL